ncbi:MULTISPECIES: hypothetical protein [unclassified Luteimonas]|nr:MULTISPECIES: hypothetical protein [unclassified Luteimonas]MBB1473099.1 hypothetical protein [Luteimonas sp. MC1782]MBB6598197.1 hypothetical protein [Luteimonas sp. MC1825]QOC88420.1 hypothetical protein IDM46_01210 [Luteimonas sp. MC1825]
MSAKRDQPPGDPRVVAQRRRAMRTALALALVAALVYVGFILSGVIGR